jgi:RNA-directed DNA polymerase
MALSIHDVAQQAGLSLGLAQELAGLVSSGSEDAFSSHIVRKKHGGVREIVRPGRLLDMTTKNLNRAFTADLPYRPPSHVHGFIAGRSTKTNARQHLGAKCVLRVDLEDFFPSISSERVVELLSQQGYDEKAAELCVDLVTVFRKLPIGLSTSPYLSNLAFESTDEALAAYAAQANLVFTRYVDDFAFSPDPDDRNLTDILEILNRFGWSVNSRKTAFMRRGGPQYVTGLYVGVDDYPRIPRKLKRQLRWQAHMIDKVGFETFQSDFGGSALRPEQLHGWACYLAAVEPDIGYPLIRRLEDAFNGAHDES